jgi:hypothetical protein
MKWKTAAAALLICALGAGLCADSCLADGKLRSFESRVSGKTVKSTKLLGSKKSSSRSSTGEAILIQLLAEFFIHVVPYLVMPVYYFEYSSYPYQFGHGYLVYGEGGPFMPWHDVAPRQVAWEMRAGYQLDLDGIHSWRFYTKARFTCYFTADLDVRHYFEPRGGDDFDDMLFFSLDGLFNIFNSPVLDFDLGLGFSYIEGIDVYGGLNVKFTGDIFPRQPLGIHFAAAAHGFQDAVVYETDFEMGLFFRNVEIRAGYRSTWVEDVAIHGPIVEVAFWIG